MITFTDRELKQIASLAQDYPKIMEVVMGNIPGLSIAGAKLDMLQIQLKAEGMLMELVKPQEPKLEQTHAPTCKAEPGKCWGECLGTLPTIGDLKKQKIKQ